MQRVEGFKPSTWPSVRFRPMSTSTSPSPSRHWRAAALAAGATLAPEQPERDRWRVFLDPVGHRFASRRSSLIDEESSEFSGTTAFGSKATFQEKLRNREPSEGSGVSTHVYRYARIDDTVHYVGE